MSRARDRPRKPGRNVPFREPKKKILIVCEGKHTEPQYFEQFVKAHREAIVDVETVPDRGVPLSVVREAKKRKQQADADARRQHDPFVAYDAVWCVFDVDEHPNIAPAKDEAKQAGLNVAMSNPCFELWLFLHLYEEPGLIHRHAVQANVKKLIPHYDKSIRYEDYEQGYDRAVERAKRLDRLAADINEPGRNPTTGVYKLTESIAPPRRDPEAQTPAKSRSRGGLGREQ